MANRLQLKRGTGTPPSLFYEGEPQYDKSGKTLYIGHTDDLAGIGTASGVAVASSDTYRASLEMLYKSTVGAAGSIRFYQDRSIGNNFVAIAASETLAASYVLRLPGDNGAEDQVLRTDGNGNLSWVDQTAGFGGFSISDGATTQSISDGNTITFISGIGVSAVVSATDTVTISAVTASTTTAGIASFSSADFTVTAGGLVELAGTATFDSASVTNLNVTGLATFSQAITGTASTANSIKIDPIATNQSYNILFAYGSGIGQTVGADSELIYNPNSNTLTLGIGVGVTQFVSSVSTGNTSASLPTSSAVIDYVGTQIAGIVTSVIGTANEIEVTRTGAEVQIGLPNNVNITNDLTVGGNLVVVGTAVTFQTEIVQVEDRLIELGLVGGGTTTSSTWDLGVAFNYGANNTAKKAGVIWLDNQFIGIASAITVTNDTGTGFADPQVQIDVYAPVAAGGLYIGGITSNELVINSAKEAKNLIFDGGSY